MKGTVYRIDFPTGEFYIGSTKLTLDRRFYAHKRGDNTGYINLKSKLIAMYSKTDLLEMTTVLYIGEDFRDYEGYLIEENQDSINIIQPKYNRKNALYIKKILGLYPIVFKKRPQMELSK